MIIIIAVRRKGEAWETGAHRKRESSRSMASPRGRQGPAHEGRRVASPHGSGAEQSGARHFSGANWKAGERVRRASASYPAGAPTSRPPPRASRWMPLGLACLPG